MPAHSTFKLIHSDTISEIKLEYGVLRKSVLVLRSVNHHLRQKIIKFLDVTPQLTVTEIYMKLGLEQSVASQHLAILRRSGVVITKREGKFIFYSLNKARLKEIAGMVTNLIV